MQTLFRRAFVGSTALFAVALLHACVDGRRAPTSPSPAASAELSGQAIGWECLRAPEPNAGNITGPWTFPQISTGCPAITSTSPSQGAPVNGPVRNLRATVTGNTVRLDWEYPLNEFVNGFLVEAGSGPGLANLALLQLPSAPPFVVVTGVPNGVYYVRVRGTGGPLGPPSNEVIVRVGVTCGGPPGPPVNFTHNVAGSNVFLLWGAPGSGDAPLSYIVEAGTGPGLANLVVFDTGSLATSLTVGAPNGLYYTRLRARNGCGTSGPSNERVIGVGVTPPTTTSTGSSTTTSTGSSTTTSTGSSTTTSTGSSTTTSTGSSTTTSTGSSTTTTAGSSTTTTGPSTTTTAPSTSTSTSSSTTSTSSSTTTIATTTSAGTSFSAVWANMSGCLSGCHNSANVAPPLRFSSQAEAFNFAVPRSSASNPDGSTFLVKASGGGSHSGGTQWPFGGSSYTTARNWMTSGMAP